MPRGEREQSVEESIKIQGLYRDPRDSPEPAMMLMTGLLTTRAEVEQRKVGKKAETKPTS